MSHFLYYNTEMNIFVYINAHLDHLSRTGSTKCAKTELKNVQNMLL